MTETMRALVDRLAGDDGALKAQLLAYGREIQTDFELNEALNLAEPEEGNELMVAAAMHLKARGIVLADASQEQLLDALQAVSW